MKFRRFKTVFDSIFLADIISTSDIIANLLYNSGDTAITQDATFYKREFRPKIGEMVEVEYRGEITYAVSEKIDSGFLLTIAFKTYDGKRDEAAKILYSVL